MSLERCQRAARNLGPHKLREGTCHVLQRVGLLNDGPAAMLDRKRGLLPITAGEEERDIELEQPVGDRETGAVTEVDVEDGQIRRGCFEKVQRALRGRMRRDVIRAKPHEDILGIEGNNEAVLDEQYAFRRQKSWRWNGG